MPKEKLYYGWVVVWVVFAALLISAGVLAILASLMVLIIRRESTPFAPEAARS